MSVYIFIALSIVLFVISFTMGFIMTIRVCSEFYEDDAKPYDEMENAVHFALCVVLSRMLITGSALALHCCKAHEKINRKMGNSTSCKIVTLKISF